MVDIHINAHVRVRVYVSLCYCINVPETPNCGCSTSIPVHTVEYMWLDARDSNLEKLCNVEVSTPENRHLLIEGCAGKQSIHYVIRLRDLVTSQQCFPVRMLRCANAVCQIQDLKNHFVASYNLKSMFLNQ